MPQSKQRVSVELPSQLTDFLRVVHQRITDGDEAATTIESDDLLQCECVYGGLCDIDNQRYGFRYFHTDDHTWDFNLYADQISAIATGSTTHLNLWKCETDCGCFHASEDAYCTHCDSTRQFDNYEHQLRIHEPDADDDTRQVMKNLRKVGLAILDYHKEHHCFPPHATSDEAGNRLHSWRSLILPFLGEDAIFDMIDFDLPWDSKPNMRIWEHQPSVYSSADCAPPLTQTLGVVGPQTIWPTSQRRAWTEITSGTSFTIAAVRANQLNANWMEPTDPDVDALVNDFEESKQLIAVFVDGHVETLRDVSREQLRKLLFI